jgi:hypothetical protein
MNDTRNSLLVALGAIAAALIFLPKPSLEQQLAAHSRAMTCASLRADQNAYFHAAVLYNSAASYAGHGADVKAPILMPQPPLYVLEAVRGSGGC